MTDYKLSFQNVSKTFGRRLIFKNINHTFSRNGIYGFAGKNGSGKSTLMKIAASINSPTKGEVLHEIDGNPIRSEKLHNYMGFVAPYLMLYDEFTADENLRYFSKIRGIRYNAEKAKYLLNSFELFNRRNDYLKGYSSGMKQRIKFIFALLHNPNIILLDEPTSNLDNTGKNKVYELIEAESKSKIVIIASNEDSDLELCSEILNIESFKNS